MTSLTGLINRNNQLSKFKRIMRTQATEALKGKATIATTAQTTVGTNNSTIISPKHLKEETDKLNQSIDDLESSLPETIKLSKDATGEADFADGVIDIVATVHESEHAANASLLEGHNAAYYTNVDNADAGILPLVRGGTGETTATGTGSIVKSVSPTLTGSPKAPTAAKGTNNTQIASTAFVKSAIGSIPPSSSRVYIMVKNMGNTGYSLDDRIPSNTTMCCDANGHTNGIYVGGATVCAGYLPRGGVSIVYRI